MLKILSAPLSKQSVIKSKEVVMCCYVCYYLLFDLISAYTAPLPADFTLIIRFFLEMTTKIKQFLHKIR